MNESAENWIEANQRYLAAALAVLRELLERHAARVDAGRLHPHATADSHGQGPGPLGEADEDDSPARQAFREAAAAMPSPSALENLCDLFGLTDFERDVLLLCTGMELDAGFSDLCAAAQGDARLAYPTFGLALAALPNARWDAISPTGPLRRWRFVEIIAGDVLTASPMRIDERTLHYLVGVSHIDQRLHGLIEPVAPPVVLPPSHQSLVKQMVALWRQARDASEFPIIQLNGPDSASGYAVAAVACFALGAGLHVLRTSTLPAAPAERDALARLWEREAMLCTSALLLDHENVDGADNEQALQAFLETVKGILIVSSREPVRAHRRTVVRLEVARPTATEQKTLWRQALGPAAGPLNGEVDNVTAQFNFGVEAIRSASVAVLEQLPLSADKSVGRRLWEACRLQARPRLDDLAERIEPAAAWDDLVLPAGQLQVLRQIAMHVRQRTQVYDRWGFTGKSPRGLSISALFSGPSGTGKTMASEVLANELRLDLYRIDLSTMVSKYIGETEKNLRRLFDAAEGGGAILLFDEADALFGKRSEVKDSHDRYANIEVSYLLQRVEAYRGLAILTTNMKQAIDPAFLRRIRFVVHFPFPDAGQRAQIWSRVFPVQTPTDRLDLDKLARLNVSGGNIRNIALSAAFLAADAGEAVCMKHLLLAAQTEYAKLEKPLGDAETRGWT